MMMGYGINSTQLNLVEKEEEEEEEEDGSWP